MADSQTVATIVPNAQVDGINDAELAGLATVQNQNQTTVNDDLDATWISAANSVSNAQTNDALDAALIDTANSFRANNAIFEGTGVASQTWVTNPLHDYESYTYSLSLHLLGINYFNYLLQGNNAENYVPQNVLVTSAGRYGSTFKRNTFFSEDFYFDEMKFKTYVNVTTRNRNSNLIEIDFTIIEPIGFTLINRLLLAAGEVNGSNGNYIKMPYLLQIDFYGYKDGQLTQIQNQTKRIPITLVTCSSKVTSKGTEYRFSAVPFNHQAFNQAIVVNPIGMNVTGGTVKEIFGTGALDPNFAKFLAEKSTIEAEKASVVQRIDEINRRESVTGQVPTEFYSLNSQLTNLNAVLANYSNANSRGFTDALNTHLEQVRLQNKLSWRHTINVEFHPLIGNSPLFSGGYVNVASTPGTGSAKNTTQQAAGQAKGQLSFNGTTANIPAGTKIDQLIDWAVRNSDYIKNQINDPTLPKDNPENLFSQVLKWYRIIPRVNKILGFDSQTNTYALDITYVVKPFNMASKYPYAPKGRVPGYVKRYDYIYTGQNKDVIDVSLDFDMLYLVELSSFRTKHNLNETAKTQGSGPAANPDIPATQSTLVNNPIDLDRTNESPVALHFTSDNSQVQDATGAARQKQVAAADLARSITLGARGDMINIRLKIIGDPHFIKQDDLFLGQTYLDVSGQFTVNNSLWMDRGELYVFLNFESPVDYNEVKGFADVLNSPYKYSEFNGVYKIITIDNIFARGQFEQTLDLVKVLYDQEGKPLLSTSLTQRADVSGQNVLGQLIPNQFVRFSGPSVNLNNLSSLLNPQAATALALASAVAGGGASSLASGLLNQGLQVVTGRISQEINKALSPILDKAVAGVKDIFSKPTFSTNPADYKSFDATSSDYGAFGEDPTSSITSGVPVESYDIYSDQAFSELGLTELDTAAWDAMDAADAEVIAGLEIELDVGDFNFADFSGF